MSAPEQISRHSFYQGLLVAARAAGAPTEFDAEGRSFHDAFDAVVERLRTGEGPRVRGLEHAKRDPVFGVYHEANELLLQAEQDLILGFANPTLRKAQFKLDPAHAKEELSEFDHAPWLEEIGKLFAARLNASQPKK